MPNFYVPSTPSIRSLYDDVISVAHVFTGSLGTILRDHFSADRVRQQDPTHQLQIPVVSVRRSRSDACHLDHPVPRQTLPNRAVPVARLVDPSQDHATSTALLLQSYLRTRWHADDQPSHVHCPPTLLNSDDNDSGVCHFGCQSIKSRQNLSWIDDRRKLHRGHLRPLVRCSRLHDDLRQQHLHGGVGSLHEAEVGCKGPRKVRSDVLQLPIHAASRPLRRSVHRGPRQGLLVHALRLDDLVRLGLFRALVHLRIRAQLLARPVHTSQLGTDHDMRGTYQKLVRHVRRHVLQRRLRLPVGQLHRYKCQCVRKHTVHIRNLPHQVDDNRLQATSNDDPADGRPQTTKLISNQLSNVLIPLHFNPSIYP